jgi:GrpB-like predicted nucleotidyltransferase (UPF0157 family)
VPESDVALATYDEDWGSRASALIARLHQRLGPQALRIDHIGSTAIPGMAAKDVIDLQVSVADLEGAARAFDAPLAEEGFVRGPYECDHVPAGSGDDPALWVKRFWSRRGHDGGDVNLHARVAGSPNERLALLFRDWLRAHPAAVAAYTAFKAALAEAVGDLGTYTDVKDSVVDVVVAAAEPWAAASGWRP